MRISFLEKYWTLKVKFSMQMASSFPLKNTDKLRISEKKYWQLLTFSKPKKYWHFNQWNWKILTFSNPRKNWNSNLKDWQILKNIYSLTPHEPWNILVDRLKFVSNVNIAFTLCSGFFVAHSVVEYIFCSLRITHSIFIQECANNTD